VLARPDARQRPVLRIDTPIIIRAFLAAPDPEQGELLFSGGIVEGTTLEHWDKSAYFIGPGKLQVHGGKDGKLLAEYDLPAPGLPIADNRLTLGERGACLFKNGETYYGFAPRWQTHDERASYDAVLWTADNVYGPYVETKIVFRGTGPVTVCQDTQDGWKAVAGLPNDGPPKILKITLP